MIEDDAWERIRRQIRRLEQTPRNTDRSGFQFQPTPTIDHRIGKANGTIPARSGTTPGSGSAIAWHVSTGSSLAVYGSSLSVYNLGAEIAADSYVMLHRHAQSGRWLVEIPQGGNNSQTSPTIGDGFPCVVRTNSSSQTVTGTTTLKLQTAAYTYPTGSSAFTFSTTADEFRFAETGLYYLGYGVSGAFVNPGAQGWVRVELDGTQIDGTMLTFAGNPAVPLHAAWGVHQAITSTTQAVRFRVDDTYAATLSVNGSSTTGWARVEVRKVANL